MSMYAYTAYLLSDVVEESNQQKEAANQQLNLNERVPSETTDVADAGKYLISS